MKKLINLLLTSLIINFIHSQNLVPNPSFEKVNKITKSWVANDLIFEERMQEWTSPDLGSPDILFNKNIHQIFPPRKKVDLTPHKARTGFFMLGIKTFGCQSNTFHCKEYAQVKLNEPIKKGQKYYIEFWANPISTSIFSNNLGIALSDVEIQDDSEYGIYYITPIINENSIIQKKPNDWHRISATITSDNNYEYIIIGNFYPDSDTKFVKSTNSINYSYYLIDDVLVLPLDSPLDFNSLNLEVGNKVILNNIQFEVNKSEILDASELDKLVLFMKNNPEITIRISGHTDNQGEKESNLKLSNERAKSVAQYLISNGIQSNRIISQGFGESEPISTNETQEGRKLNRRVEFEIINI